MQSIIDFITKLLSGVVDSFKLKNPVVYTVVALVLGFIYYITGSLEAATLPDGSSLLIAQWDGLMETARNIIVTLLALIGAHTASNKTLPPATPSV